LEESKYFVLIMTPGFNLSPEVVKEISMARKKPAKHSFSLDIEVWGEI
jgi:hypothetical protein